MKRERTLKAVVTLSLVLMGLLVSSSLAAYNTLHTFSATDGGGQWPSSGFVEQGGDLYGLTPYGGVSNCGTFFSVNTNSGAMTVLYRFAEQTGCFPMGNLCYYNSRFYGMTARGGTNDLGVIFSMGVDGNGYTVEHTFGEGDPLNGSFPWGGFVENGGMLYGMTYRGGTNNQGVVMRFNPATGAYTNLHSFAGGEEDGRYPQGNLVVAGGCLYGMTPQGGTNGCGVVFGINFDGSGYNCLYEFAAGDDGCNPSGSLLADGDLLYGMSRPASGNAGSVWSVDRLSGAFSVLHVFTGAADDGADPYGALIKHNGSLYGMTRFGGVESEGVVFRLGGSFEVVHHFTNGGEPYGDLLVVDDEFYGMAFNDGDNFVGSVFSMDIPTDDDPVAYAAMTWIDGGAMQDTWLGDENLSVVYAQHNTNGGLPEAAYVGYGRTQNADDETWTWLPMGRRAELVNDNYEYTGTIGRASVTGEYVVAVKFVKGLHTYYTQPSFGSWGDWDTALYATNVWNLNPLTAPSSISSSYASDSNTVMFTYTGDGQHWVNVFRKDGVAPTMTAPENGTAYSVGTSYPDQGLCVYAGDAGAFVDTNVVADSNYRYAFYTENWSYYSAAVIEDVETVEGVDPDGDDNGNNVPNWWEILYFGDATSMDEYADADGDGMNNGGEYAAGTNPLDVNDVLSIEPTEFKTTGGGEPTYGPNLLMNEGFENGSASWTTLGNSTVNGWKPQTGSQNAILTTAWLGGQNYATVLQKVSAISGTDYRAGGSFFREVAWTYATTIKLEFLNSSDAVIETESTSMTTLPAEGWRNVLVSGTAPVGAAYAQIVIEATGIDGDSGTFFMDDMKIETVTSGDSEAVDLSWTMKTGRVYRVEYRDSMTTGSWQPITTNLTSGTEQVYTLTDTNSIISTATRLYRVGAKLP